MKILKIDNTKCDVFWGVEFWHDTEWTRFQKTEEGWTAISGPYHYKWYNSKTQTYEIYKAYRPKGSKLKDIVRQIEQEYN